MDNFEFIKTRKTRCKNFDTFSQAVTTFNKSGIYIFHLNIRSINKHFDKLKLCLNYLLIHLNILVLTEVNLHEDVGNFYNLDGCKAFKRLRINKRGGGIILYISNQLQFNEITVNSLSLLKLS